MLGVHIIFLAGSQPSQYMFLLFLLWFSGWASISSTSFFFLSFFFFFGGGGQNNLLWMDELLHHFETMVEKHVCWSLQGTQLIPGLLSSVVRDAWISATPSTARGSPTRRSSC